MIKELQEEQEEVKDNQTWLAIEDHIRSLESRNEEIKDRNKQINSNLKQLEKADEEFKAW
jgi:cell division protein ZapA (FtsZ GTPase activity inhibitor)